MSLTFESDRLVIKMSDVSFTDALVKYYSDNRKFFSHAEPERPDSYFTHDTINRVLEQEMHNIENSISYYYYFASKENPDVIIGSMSFVRIRKMPYYSCIFGYDLDEHMQGHGYATEACAAAIKHILSVQDIHRLEARVRTDNERSIKLLERLGFLFEGDEFKSIYLEGEFRDHYRYAYINEDF
ncbi:MAG: GNAT family N-acetyltransferase [Lachnospiraceae bacterium]|nr:GNAT family N-acetyltransferase [Lachnospiraceae bacterium]